MPNSSFCLPEDVLYEIFVRLPFKSICKLRCLSKSCLSLLSNTYFIDLVFKKLVMTISGGGCTPWTMVTQRFYKFDNATQERSIFTTSSTQLHNEFISTYNQFSFEFIPAKTQIRPLASSSGLVLCSTHAVSHTDYFIFNPFTGQSVSLRRPVYEVQPAGLTGFVFNSSTGIYKIINIPYSNMKTSNFNLQIFSSDTNEWSTHHVICSQEVSMISGQYQYHVLNYNGVWYWVNSGGYIMIAYDDNHKVHNNGSGGGGGECRIFNLPRRDKVKCCNQICLRESKGLLCYGQIEEASGKLSTISVWVFRDRNCSDGSTWQLVCKDIEIDDYITGVSPLQSYKKYVFVGFSPVDPNVVIIECYNGGPYRRLQYEMAFNVRTRKPEVLLSSHPVSDCHYSDICRIVVTPQPTIIPTITN